MSLILTIVIVVYVGVGAVVAFNGWMTWSVARSMQRDYDGRQLDYLGNDFVERQRAKYEREAREGARLFTQSPLWPLLALGALARMINDARGDQ